MPDIDQPEYFTPARGLFIHPNLAAEYIASPKSAALLTQVQESLEQVVLGFLEATVGELAVDLFDGVHVYIAALGGPEGSASGMGILPVFNRPDADEGDPVAHAEFIKAVPVIDKSLNVFFGAVMGTIHTRVQDIPSETIKPIEGEALSIAMLPLVAGAVSSLAHESKDAGPEFYDPERLSGHVTRWMIHERLGQG